MEAENFFLTSSAPVRFVCRRSSPTVAELSTRKSHDEGEMVATVHRACMTFDLSSGYIGLHVTQLQYGYLVYGW